MKVSADNKNLSPRDKAFRLMNCLLKRPRLLTALLALFAFCVAAASVLLTAWLQLNPCYLCIVQRSLSVLVAACLGLCVLINRRAFAVISLPLSALLSLGGMVAAAFQSVEQWYPHDVSCIASRPNILERAVDWLGNQYPTLFMATGFCEDKELEILGLSLANWSFLCFTVFAVGAIWLFVRQIRNTAADNTDTD